MHSKLGAHPSKVLLTVTSRTNSVLYGKPAVEHTSALHRYIRGIISLLELHSSQVEMIPRESPLIRHALVVMI